ncbi:zf-HC2 domain-containing protein [Candidatus Poribacteria bacterium]|nr:zf-HC2 domain-containing protein [Candidatus Poribacteria bacterium]
MKLVWNLGVDSKSYNSETKFLRETWFLMLQNQLGVRKMKMIHNQIQKQLSAYLDDELSPCQRRRLEKHLVVCEECSLLLQELRETSDSIASLRQTAPEDLWFAINTKLEGISSGSRRSLAAERRWTWGQIYPITKPVIAAIGIVLVVCTIFIRVFLHKLSEISPEYTQMDVYLTAHTQYYSQKMLTPDFVLNGEQQNADTATENQQSTDSSELDFYLSVYLGEDEI